MDNTCLTLSGRYFKIEVTRLRTDMKIPSKNTGKIDCVGRFCLQCCQIGYIGNDPLSRLGGRMPVLQLYHDRGTELPVIFGLHRQIASGHGKLELKVRPAKKESLPLLK